MKRTAVISILAVISLTLGAATSCKGTPPAQRPSASEEERWRGFAERVTIVRDDWGIPHVTGQSDADAVFGLMVAQCEDDFRRVEENLINAMGRLAEAEGEAEIFRDLRMKLFIDPVELQAQYASAPGWLQALMVAWADGLNFYLSRHPQVKPRVITRFEPWMALSFSEGSIGGDIERIELAELQAFYGGAAPTAGAPTLRSSLRDGLGGKDPMEEPSGSNGFALAPARSQSGHPLLLINPHTSFFFREEAQVTSGEGLNAYGALTWGQFFVYQGFNEHTAWMHTSSGVDNIDEFAETIVERGGQRLWKSGAELLPLLEKKIVVPYRTATGMAQREFTIYRTAHGPIVRAADGKWISVALMHKPVEALMQSFGRTKTRGYDEFRRVMELHANSSNNTVFADSSGTIAYFHANFVPRRDPALDWTQPVDGSDPRAAWRGVHSFEESPNVVNPASGFIQNTNNWPYSAAGPDSPRAERFAPYFDTFGENPRGRSALRVLEGLRGATLESLIAAAYDPRLSELEAQVPLLVQAWEQAPAGDPVKTQTAEAIASLRQWDFRWATGSVATTLAVLWAEALWRDAAEPARLARVNGYTWMRTRITPAQRLAALAAVQAQLVADFGRWQMPWGELNRYQRVSGALVQPFSDDAPSLPVAFAPGRWGSLASFVAQPANGSKKRYGTAGNSFVAVVELGPRVRARAVTAGGLSSDPGSTHFGDQAAGYAAGELREVYFYPEQLSGHTEERYRPGQRGASGTRTKAP